VRKLAILFPLLFLLTGCAALGVPKADTFNKQVVVANSIVESVAETAGTLYSTGKISTEEKDDVFRQGTEARTGIKLVRQLHATDPLAAENRLNTIIVALTALQSRLEMQQ
jgi:hypothetical protein